MEFLQQETSSLVDRYQRWMNLSAVPSSSEGMAAVPGFPLVPTSKGFRQSMERSLKKFDVAIDQVLKKWQNPKP